MGAARLTPETRRRVEEAIQALDYVPNRIARGLISQKTQTIGLIVPDVVNPFFAPVVRGAESAARKAGYRILLCNSEGDLRLEREYIEDLVAHRVEGLLLAPASDRSRSSILLACCADGFPLGPDRPRAARCRLRSDRQRQRQRRAPFDRAPHRVSGIERSRTSPTPRTHRPGASGWGYREALEAAGIPFQSELVVRTTVDRIGGYRAAQEILARDPLPTAIFAVNNMTAVGTMEALRERGLSVPKDMGLVCFDDVEHLAVLSPISYRD